MVTDSTTTVPSVPTVPTESSAIVSPVADTASNAPGFRISRDKLTAAVQGLPDDQREALTWLWSYCSTRNLSRERLGSLIRKTNGKSWYSYDSLYHTLTGRRGADDINLQPLCEAIQAFRRTVDTVKADGGFIETQLSNEIWAYARRAMAQKKIGFVFGTMSIGKTETLSELARRDPNVVYTRMPTRGHLSHYVQECARRMAMGEWQTIADLRHRIQSAFSPGMLLVVDEADQCFLSLRQQDGMSTLDFLRELWDRARCGVLLVMDDAGRDAILRGPNAKRLGRLWRRRLPAFHLPRAPYAGDLDLFAARYGLPPAPDEPVRVRISYFDDGAERTREHSDSPMRLQQDVVSSENGGLSVWLGLLQEAADMAKAQRRPVTWGAVIKAHCEFSAMEFAEMEVGL